MTGSYEMADTTREGCVARNVDEFEEVETIPYEKDYNPESIATLDVTPEEINFSHTGLKQCSSQLLPEGKFSDQIDAEKRRRSETWTFGIGEKSQSIQTSSAFSSDSKLNHSHFPSGTKQLYNSDNNLHSSSTGVGNIEGNFHCRSMSSLSDHNSETLDQHSLNNSSLDNINIESKRTSIISNYSLNCEFQNLDITNNDQSQTEFTDINLHSNGTDECDGYASNTVIDNGGVVATQEEKQSGRPSIGSFFEWISSTKSSSPANSSKQIDTLEDTVNSSVNSKSTRNDVQQSNNETTEYNLSTPSNSSTSEDNEKIPAIKSFGKTLKSTFSGKNRFWKNQMVEPLSTTALILEDRPRNLPSKSSEEAERHRIEYEKMVANAKRHELRDVQKRKKHLRAQRKQEEAIVSTSMVWTNEVLPNWNTMNQTSRTRQLWWQGLPPSVRGKVWQLAIGNELNITKDLYNIMVTRAHDKLRSMNETQSFGEETESLAADRECTVELIRLDISRTFPHLCIFQKGGPYHDLLHDILGAYASYRPDVGYVQGMSFMAAMLLLNMEPAEAFITFANLLNKPCQVAFFRLNEELMKTYFATFEVFFEENLPKLFAHFKQHNLTPDMFLIDWIFTMFSKALALDTASRVWDMFCRDGEDFLFKTAIAILKMHSDLLLRMEFIHAAQFLTRLPTTADFTHQQLFDQITEIVMVSRGNRRWKDVLSLMKDAS